MLKNFKLSSSLVAVLALFTLFSNIITVYADNSFQTSSFSSVTVSASTNAINGSVTLIGTNNSGKKLKILVRKDNIETWYDVEDKREFSQTITLVNQPGLFNIYIMIQEYGNFYAYGPSLTVNNVVTKENQENTATLLTINPEDEKIIELSKKLTEGKKTDIEKVEAIYKWIVENINYDYEKYNNILIKNFNDQYGPIVALTTKKGVCYDYSTLFASLCRTANVPVKVAKGYSMNALGYHAWNEVFIAEKNQWMVVDVTVDSIKYHKTKSNVIFTPKPSEEYYKIEEM